MNLQLLKNKSRIRVRINADKKELFDPIRKKWFVQTPEEWVRQLLISHLTESLKWPSSYLSVEREIHVGKLKKRFDILIYDELHQPWMLVECKAYSQPLNEAVLNQALRYNRTLDVRWLLLCNGTDTLLFDCLEEIPKALDAFPEFGT